MVRNAQSGEVLGTKVANALGLDSQLIRRIILDMEAGEMLTAYIVLYPGADLDIEWDAVAERSDVRLLQIVEDQTERQPRPAPPEQPTGGHV